MACFEDPTLRNGPYACILIAYAAEEGAYDTNELALVLDEVGGLRRAQLAVVLEPTNLDVHLGAMGALHAEFGFHGRAAHSARPWQGQSALTKALPLLADLAGRQPLDVSVDGLGWREVVTATRAWTGDAGSGRITNARNVVPDRFTVNVNYRYAPDKRPEQAEEVVAELAAACGADEVHIVDHAPAGPPHREAPLVARFVEVTAARIEPKQAWTDAARFAALGVPAVNYGPGLTAQAHQPGEYVPEANLAVAADRLAAFLAGRTLGGRSLGTAAPAAAPSGRRGGPAAGSAGG
jgi:succinyl-diaminopimelate desuccinylase